jgi:KaiC/GvpD/RAD55 family RecA-like ATPase
MKNMEWISTGVDGLDALIRGYPKGKTFLVSGVAGAGKTILALHFLNACCKDGMKCLYIAMEENPEDLKAQAMSFGWDLEEYEQRGLLKITNILEQGAEKVDTHAGMRLVARIEKSYQNIMDIFSEVYKEIVSELSMLDEREEKGKVLEVVVIDNIGALAIGIPVPKLREQLDSVVSKLNELRCTALIICDETVAKITDDVMMYSVYGGIKLMKRDNPYLNKRERVMDIVKIRNTKTPLEYLLFDITDKGIEIITKS